jgi:hypothetical protein
MASCRPENDIYSGFEQGPIRPPSEAGSLLLRLTRNCPWNNCTFCPVYKGARFSLRPIEHVLKDIDAVHRHVVRLRESMTDGRMDRATLNRILSGTDDSDMDAFHAAVNWMQNGMESIFLQDANSLILKPTDLITILEHIRSCFPWATRITSYARSHTVARISDDDMRAIRQAGLSRIHIGMESASDKVLDAVRKGTTKAMQITAGIKVKQAGIELSEYVMPGLGGIELSREHALETADALNRINADFIRLRSLAIPGHVPLYEDYRTGAFKPCTDIQTAEEILLFLKSLDGITSTVKSDHVLNLFQDVEGTYPRDKDRMTGIIRSFLALPEPDRMYCQIGRRLGMIRTMDDMKDPSRMAHIKDLCRTHGITPETVDGVIEDIIRRFI